jgi:hypothetical protein
MIPNSGAHLVIAIQREVDVYGMVVEFSNWILFSIRHVSLKPVLVYDCCGCSFYWSVLTLSWGVNGLNQSLQCGTENYNLQI